MTDDRVTIVGVEAIRKRYMARPRLQEVLDILALLEYIDEQRDTLKLIGEKATLLQEICRGYKP